ncbi:hypothetical protein ACFL2C_02895 [Patescibacteria group bacterium]
MPRKTVQKRKKLTRRKKKTAIKAKSTKVIRTPPTYKHKFLVDKSEDMTSPLYYMLIFFTLSLMIGVIYAGVDSYQRLEVHKINSFEKCTLHSKSIIRESSPRLCTTIDDRSFYETINKLPEPTPSTIIEDDSLKSSLTISDVWTIDRLGYDAYDVPTIWLYPAKYDYTQTFRYPHELVIGGKYIYFVSGDLCATDACEFDRSDTITYDEKEYAVSIFKDPSTAPDIPRHTFQVDVGDGGPYISASYYNLDQFEIIKELTKELDPVELEIIFGNLTTEI